MTLALKSVVEALCLLWSPLDLDIECEEPQTSSAQRSFDGLAHVGTTPSLRRSLRSVRRFTLGRAPGTSTSMLRSTVRCSTRSCGMAVRDLQEKNVSFVCEQPSSLVWSKSHSSPACSEFRNASRLLLVLGPEQRVHLVFVVLRHAALVLFSVVS